MRYTFQMLLHAAIMLSLTLNAFSAEHAWAQEQIRVATDLTDDLTTPLGDEFVKSNGIRINWVNFRSPDEIVSKVMDGSVTWDAVIGLSADTFASLAPTNSFEPIATKDSVWPYEEFGDKTGSWLPIGAVYSGDPLAPDIDVAARWSDLQKSDPAKYQQPVLEGVGVFKDALKPELALTFAKWISTDPAASSILAKHYLLVPSKVEFSDRTIPPTLDFFFASFGPGSCVKCQAAAECSETQPVCSSQQCCITKP